MENEQYKLCTTLKHFLSERACFVELGSAIAIQTGFRHICRKSTAAPKTKNVADRSRQRERTDKRHFNEGKLRPYFKRMYFSDDSTIYETTASQDERIGQKLEQEKEEEKLLQISLESERKEIFEEVFLEKSLEIFDLPGLTFLKFTHMKIKFCFEPRKVVNFVNKNVKFYCSLKYYERYKIWNIRRDSFPVNYKARIYNIFYRGQYFSVDDESVATAILRIYLKLNLWAQKEQDYRQEKFMRYQNGVDVVLDSDDEELFLTEEQRQDLHAKREKVLRRMIPPSDIELMDLPPKRTGKKRIQAVTAEYQPKKKRRHRIVVIDSD